MSDKIKVVFYGANPMATYGTSKVINEITSRLVKDNRFNVSVIAHDYNGIPNRTKEGVNILPVPYVQRGSEMYVKNIIAYLNSLQPDIFIPFTDAFLLFDEGLHNIEFSKSKTKLIGYFNLDSVTIPQGGEVLSKKCDRIIVSSHFAKDQYNLEGMTSDVIWHGVDTSKFFKDQSKRVKMRQHLGLKEDDFVFLSVARNSARKNMSALFLAFADMCYRYDNVKLLVHMPDHTTFRKDWLDFHERTVTKLCGGKNPLKDSKVIFTKEAGRMGHGAPEEFIVGLYNAADIAVSSSNGEGFSFKISESFASELPIIAPDNTTTLELIGNKVYEDIGPRGWIVSVNQAHCVEMSAVHYPVNIKALTETMIKAYNTPLNIREVMGRNGRQFAIQYLDWDEKANQFIDIFMQEMNREKEISQLADKVML